jgi:hypothetical protein
MKNILTGNEISNEELASLSKLVARQVSLEEHIRTTEEELSKVKESLRTLSEQTIPEVMIGMGLSELRLSTGESVTISKYYSARIPDAVAEQAFEWLRQQECDDIIKNNISLSFGKGEDDLAQEVGKLLVAKGLAPEQKIFVHPMTLKSFVKERIESNQELPQELFGVFVGNKTKIVTPKPSTKKS